MTVSRQITGPLSYIVAACRKKDRTDATLKIVFLSLQMLDLTLTLIAARSGWPELNPFMRASLDSLYKVALFKFTVPVLVSWFVPGRLLVPAILLIGGVVGWNVKELIGLAF